MPNRHPQSYRGRKEVARKKAQLRKLGRAFITSLYIATFALIALAIYRG